MSKVIKKLGKTLLHSIAGVVLAAILLILATALALSLPRVQSFVASQAADFLSKKVDTKLAIEAISIENLSKLCVEGLYVEDLKGDTLLYAKKLTGAIDRQALLSDGKLIPSNIKGDGVIFALITREGDNRRNNLDQVIEQFEKLFPSNKEKSGAGFAMDDIYLEDSIFRLYDQESAGRVPATSIDYSDMDIAIHTLALERLAIKDGVVGLYGVSSLDVTDKSGASLQNSSFGQLEISEGTLDFREVDFTSKGTLLKLPILILKGETWEKYSQFCDQVTLTVETAGSKLNPISAGIFVDALGRIAIEGERIEGNFVGTVNDFRADISANLYDSEVVVDGSVKGITRFATLRVDTEIDLETTSQKVANIYRHIVGEELPAAAKQWIERFEDISVVGSAALKPNQVVADVALHTDLGSATVDGTLDYSASGFAFDGNVAGDGLEAGRILEMEQLGKADVALKGAVQMASGEVDGDLDADISRIAWAGYDYNNITLQASMHDKAFRAAAVSADPNIAFTLDGDGVLDENNPEYNMIISLDRADLGALGFTKGDRPSWLAGSVEATLTGRSLDDMVGRAMVNNFIYVNAADTLSTELINISLRGGEQDKSFSLRSNIADVEYRSMASYSDVLDYITKSLPAQLPWVKREEQEGEQKGQQDDQEPYGDRLYMAEDYTSVNLKVFDGTHLASVFIPESNISSGSSVTLEFSPAAKEFALNIESNRLEMKDILISGLNIDATGNGPWLNLDAESGSLAAMGLIIPDITIQASSNDNREVEANLYFSDTDTAVSGQLGAMALLAHDANGDITARATLTNSYLISPEQRWIIEAAQIDYSSEGVTIDDFVVHSGVSSIGIDGTIDDRGQNPLHLSLVNVPIDEWVALLGSMEGVSGNIDGQLELYSALKRPYGKGELKLTSLSMGEIDLDPMLFRVEIPQQSTTAKASLKNTVTKSTLAMGEYDYSRGTYEAKLTTRDFQFSILEPMLKGIVHDLEGSGDINVELSGGNNQGLDINGVVKAAGLATTVDYTGAHYSIPSLNLNFKENRCILSPIRIEDKEGGWASAEANINLKNLGAITFDASVEPHNLIAIDLAEDSNSPFYGKVYVADGGIKLSSRESGITISGAVNTGNNSVFSIPLTGNNDFAGADFVTFVDNSAEDDEEASGFVGSAKGNKETKNSNLTVDMMLGVDTNTLLRLIIDPETDNVIEARGNANLGVTLDARKNDFAIRGDYQITEGVYNFNFQNIITKNFDINPGSYIRWNGSPLDANIDVAATYKLKTSLAPLLGTESTASRASTPVECIVKLTGSLAKVDVSFDINVPTANTEYQTILSSYFASQEMMATQFVYLLALGNFYSDSSTGPNTTAGAAGTAIGLDFLASQVSKLVSNDAYKFNLKYKAIDDTSSSYSIDFQTEIIDDRLTLELEANVDTGDYFETIGNNNQLSGGGSITLRLDPTGSVYLKGFSRTIDRFDENQGLQENGVGIYFQRSFDHFGDLFDKKKEATNGETEKIDNFAPDNTPEGGEAETVPVEEQTEATPAEQ